MTKRTTPHMHPLEREKLQREIVKIKAETLRAQREDSIFWRFLPSGLTIVSVAIAAIALFLSFAKNAREEAAEQLKRYRTLQGSFEIPRDFWHLDDKQITQLPRCEDMTLDPTQNLCPSTNPTTNQYEMGSGLLCRSSVVGGSITTEFRRYRCWQPFEQNLILGDTHRLPTVTAAISALDFDTDGPDRHPRLQVFVPKKNITGFEVNVQTWGASQPHMVGIVWQANGITPDANH